MPELELARIAVLAAVAFAAGTIDAVAGGGGLLTLPALLWAGIPPHLALGTNKGQSVFGAFAALARFARGGMIDGARARVTFPLGLAGSLVGATLVLAVPPAALRPLVLALLAAAAAFVAFRRPGAARFADAPPPPHAALRAAGIAAVIGGYDGFFGPGTGTFLIVAFVALLGDGLAHASADAKVVNFASNLAALTLFATRGTVIWRVALPMAAAQLAGGWLGAHLAIRRGDALVRRAVVAVSLALAAKLALDLR
ncbi:TSUP family transporter [Anaeromyxobacter oryzisoli]|uniref:TSUP family transporter n=1 Tax=Anaeromyxobacter oryzisoli TaxID=2925408 RepID=UPI001F5A43CC|nr:TSUP family transporter [Anaeromyxobacter sp. SG63]